MLPERPLFSMGEDDGSKIIHHSTGGLGGGGGGDGGGDEAEKKPKIEAFKQSMGRGHHEDKWIRPTNKTGTGATHVRTFHCKLTGDSLGYLDDQINDWLDTHPDYEVKFVTASVGDWTGKTKEPHMLVQVWV